MRVEEIRKIHITKEEKEILNKVVILIENISDNMDDEDELIWIDENNVEFTLTTYELKEIPWILSNIAKSKIEII